MAKRKAYLCPKCKKEHLATSKIGKAHKQYLPIPKETKVKARTNTVLKAAAKPLKKISITPEPIITKKGFHTLTGVLIILLVSFFTLVGVYFYEQTVFNEFDAQELLTGQIKLRNTESKYALANFSSEVQIPVNGSEPAFLPKAWDSANTKLQFSALTDASTKYYAYNLQTQLTEETTQAALNWEEIVNGFDLLNNLKTELSDQELSSLAVSNSGEYVSWVSGNAGKYLIYLLKKGVQSLSDKTLLGEITNTEQAPILTFTPNDTYLTTADGQQIFALESGLMLLEKPLTGQTHQAYFSPDYTKLLIITHTVIVDDQEITQLSVRDLTTGSVQEIFSSTGNKVAEPELTQITASWSPDSGAIVFNYNKQLWITDVSGAQKRQLTSEVKNYQQPNWSSDGKYIAYIADGSLYNITLNIKDLLSTKVIKVVALDK